MSSAKKIICIVGPTATGKTDVAAALARRINAEVISCDAMQVYEGMAIMNNKPPARILKAVPHHLIGFVSLEDEFDVAAYRRRAEACLEEIMGKGKIPIIAGGSGMYMQVLLDGIFEDGGGKAPHVREELTHQAQEEGLEKLYKKLIRLDPEAAGTIHPHDSRRIIRALEVILTSRKPVSQLRKVRKGIWGQYDISLFALDTPRAELYERIDRRVEEMFSQGLVDEVKGLEGRPLSRTAAGMIGMKEIRGYLNGEYDLDRAQDLMKRNTRRLAKRQLTWFRKEKRLQWIMLEGTGSIEKAVEVILRQVS